MVVLTFVPSNTLKMQSKSSLNILIFTINLVHVMRKLETSVMPSLVIPRLLEEIRITSLLPIDLVVSRSKMI
jgi:hypothetical protein